MLSGNLQNKSPAFPMAIVRSWWNLTGAVRSGHPSAGSTSECLELRMISGTPLGLLRILFTKMLFYKMLSLSGAPSVQITPTICGKDIAPPVIKTAEVIKVNVENTKEIESVIYGKSRILHKSYLVIEVVIMECQVEKNFIYKNTKFFCRTCGFDICSGLVLLLSTASLQSIRRIQKIYKTKT